MTLHFVHIGKTGGTAVKRGLQRANVAYWRDEDAHKAHQTPYGPIQLHHHRFRLVDVPPEDFVFFAVRDPVDRFISAFYSRLNKGQPRYYFEWTDLERQAFEAFPTPQRLAGALASADAQERSLAQSALRHIRHMRPIVRSVSPGEMRSRLGRVVYIARQETLATDWEQLKALLELPADAKMPTGKRRSHRRDRSLDTRLEPEALAALREWYRRDYHLLSYCDALRAWNGWGAGPRPEGVRRLRYELSRLRGLPALAPPSARIHRWLNVR